MISAECKSYSCLQNSHACRVADTDEQEFWEGDVMVFTKFKGGGSWKGWDCHFTQYIVFHFTWDLGAFYTMCPGECAISRLKILKNYFKSIMIKEEFKKGKSH